MYSDTITELKPEITRSRAELGDQYDLKIDDLRVKVKAAIDSVQGDTSLTMDSTGTPTATTGRGYVLGTGNEGLVTQLAVAAMAVRVQTGGTAYNNLGNKITIPTSTSLAIAAADASNARKDIVVVTAAGVLKVYTGTPAGSPADPALSAGDVPLARIAVAANAASIVNGNITDLRARQFVDGSKVLAASVPATALKVFNSATQTGTGANQNIAHGMGVAPQYVVWSIVDTNGVNLPYVFTEGAHTSTNIIMNVTSNVKYKVVGLF